VPEFIDPVFTKTSPKRSFSLNRKRAFWLVFAKTGSIISGTALAVGKKLYAGRQAGRQAEKQQILYVNRAGFTPTPNSIPTQTSH
jgi:hypothetical protein